jgi:alpha-glucosidase
MKTRIVGSLLLLALAGLARTQAGTLSWSGPSGVLTATVSWTQETRPTWSLSRRAGAGLETAELGVTVDGVDLGAGSQWLGTEEREGRDCFAVIGGQARACATWTERVFTFRHAGSGCEWRLEARLFDEGFAWRYVVPGSGARRVSGEASSFRLPSDSSVWLAERPNDWKLKSYAGYWMKVPVDRLADFSPVGPVQGPPLVAELPGGGYALLTEAALADYSGLRLRATGDRRLVADFTEGARGFAVTGAIVTPWRVALMAETLDALVNSQLIAALNPPPDAALFAEGAEWLKPGKVAWRWWSAGTGTPEEERAVIARASQLKFEYSLIDDGWKDWPEAWEQVARLCAYGRDRGVRILLWCDYKDLADPAGDFAALRAFLDRVQAVEAAGVKLDFFNAESKDRIDFELRALREAAQRRLLVIFHGIQKPTGEARTWPNELTREGIRGLELNKMKEGPITAEHNCALVFTRLVVGAGDYTPLGFSRPGPTTWAHQLATLVVFTSPLQVVAENPDMLLHDPRVAPARDLIADVPTVWDETRVLAPSAIGEAAVLARRSGREWWVGAINAAPVDIQALDLSFLGEGPWRAVVVTGTAEEPLRRQEHTNVTACTLIPLTLARGDGAVIRFRPE